MPATEVQGNEDAPMSRFTIKNEPEEQLEIKREDGGHRPTQQL